MPGSEVPRGRLALPGDQGSCPRSRGVHLLSRVTWARVHGLVVSTSFPGRLRLGFKRPQCRPPVRMEMRAQLRGLRGRPHVPEDLRPGPKSHGVKRLSQATRARVQGPSCTPSSPLLPGPECEAPQFHQLSWMSCSLFRGTTVPPGVPGDLGKGPMARGFTCCPARRGRGSEGPLGRPTLPGNLHPGLRACGIDHLFWDTRAWFRGPEGSTSCAWRLGPVNEGPWCRSVLPGDSDPVPRDRGSTSCPG